MHIKIKHDRHYYVNAIIDATIEREQFVRVCRHWRNRWGSTDSSSPATGLLYRRHGGKRGADRLGERVLAGNVSRYYYSALVFTIRGRIRS